jgi:FkbM family methyltransferase
MTVQLLDKKFKIADALSFYWSHQEIFKQQIYKFYSSRKNPVILDCGSNYGTSIIYFKSIFPESTITGIEPDPKIFKLLEWNINQRHLQDIKLINKAITSQRSSARFYREGADAGRLSPIDHPEQYCQISTIKLDDLIQEPIDFLKMDIEGSETDAIISSQNLHQVSQLFIEYHSFRKSKQTLHSLLEKLQFSGFRYFIHTQFCSPRPLTEDALQVGMDLQLNIFAKKEELN